MKEVQINAFERAVIIEEFGRYAFAEIKDSCTKNYFEIMPFNIDGEGRKHYRIGPGRPGLTEAYQGAAKFPRPEAEMRQLWEKVKADERQHEERKLRASIEAKQKAEASALREAKLREAKALKLNSQTELKQLIQEGRAVDKIADNKRVGILMQRIAACEQIINTL